MRRRHLALVAASAIGMAVFVWPFFGGGQPGAVTGVAFGIGTAAALAAVEVAAGRLDARQLALLAALAALDSAARAVVVTGIGGFSPIFLLILCGGYVFGAEYGFLLGAVTILVSALVTAGLGPWLPYQLFAAGWVGAIAGLAGRRRQGRPTRRDVIVLAVVGVILGYGYGAVMDIWDWSFFQASPGLGFQPGMPLTVALDHFGRFYVATSLVYDTFRAVGNAVMVAVLGAPVLVALARLRARLHADVNPNVPAPSPDVSLPAPSAHATGGRSSMATTAPMSRWHSAKRANPAKTSSSERRGRAPTNASTTAGSSQSPWT